jgi:hypothetical protein
MTGAGLLQRSTGFSLTDAGMTWLTGTLRIEASALHVARRPVARPCLDWTERRIHLAGTAGAALCRCFLDRRWTVRIGDGRALRVTAEGRAALRDLLAIEEAALRPG